MKLKDQASWDKWVELNNKGVLNRLCVSSAKHWAELMEKELERGAALEEIAYPTSTEAGINDITGFLFGAAILMLSQCWEHGGALRLWWLKELKESDARIKAEDERAIEAK